MYGALVNAKDVCAHSAEIPLVVKARDLGCERRPSMHLLYEPMRWIVIGERLFCMATAWMRKLVV